MNSRFTKKMVNDDGGFETQFEKLKFPLFVSNRHVISTFYTVIDEETGWRSVIDSSVGNEYIEA